MPEEAVIEAPAAPAPPPQAPDPSIAGMEDVAADLYEMDDSPNKGPAPKRPEKPKDDKGRFVKQEEKKPDAKAEVDEVETKPDTKPEQKNGDIPEKPSRVKDLRNAYETLTKRVKEEYEPELNTLRSKIKEYESRQSETKPLTQEIERLKSELNQHRDRLKRYDVTADEAYQTNFVKPFTEAYGLALNDFNQMRVRIPDGQDDLGEPKFKYRAATADDLMKLASMPLDELDDEADRMFGKGAHRAIRHVEQVRDLARKQEREKERLIAEHDKNQQLQQVQTREQQETRNKAWLAENKTLAKKFPKWFAPIEGDKEGNALFEKGLAEVDRLFSPKPETAPKSIEEAVKLHARIRNKAANHDRAIHRLVQAKKRVKELETKLAEYEESEPKSERAGQPRTKSPGRWDENIAAEIAALDRPGI